MITVSRRYQFSASHRLHANVFSKAQNADLFGKCNNPFGHGHNYEMDICVSGEIDSDSGRVVDLGRLDQLVDQAIVSRYDHRYLNEELPEFEVEIPTTENLGLQIEKRLAKAWPSAFPSGSPVLQRIRIFETKRNIIELEHEDR